MSVPLTLHSSFNSRNAPCVGVSSGACPPPGRHQCSFPFVADNGWATLTVTGVIHDPVDPSHIHGDMYMNPPSHQIDLTVWWGESEGSSYIRLAAGAEAADVEAKIPLALDKYRPALQNYGKAFKEVRLQPLTDIHLFSSFPNELGVPGDVSTLYLLSALAVSLLIIAAVNFMNLTTAHSLNRLKEIGMRKVVGARRRQLALQFLGEAVVLSYLAGVLSVGLTAFILPWFSDLSGQSLTLTVLGSGPVLIGLAFLILLTGLLAGSYPALHLSGYPPLITLKQLTGTGQSRGRLRQILVTGQFTMALTLTIGAAILSQQIDYLQNRRIGLQPDQVLMIKDFGGGEILKRFDTMRQVLKQHPHIVDATRSGYRPGINIDKDMLLNGEPIVQLAIAPGFIETFGIERLSGASFTDPVQTEQNRYIISRSTAAIMGWTPEEAVGRQITLDYQRDNVFGRPSGTVIGVVNDFQIDSLRRPLEPMVLLCWKNDGFYGAFPFIKLQTEDMPVTLDYIKQVWREFLPDSPFEYTFMDEVFTQMYRAEIRLSRVSSTLAVVAVLIALLGVFGLTAYMTERRTREACIRRVLGATTFDLVRILSREMLLLVLVANLIAWPLAYFLLQQWLQAFAYRIEIGPEAFILAGLSMLALTQLTVGYHAVKTARTNPVETLRYE